MNYYNQLHVAMFWEYVNLETTPIALEYMT